MLLHALTPDIMLPRAALLGEGVLLVAVPEGPNAPGLMPPYGSVAVQGLSGPHRIAAMRQPLNQSQNPTLAHDATELAEELDPASCRRLLGFLLGFCRTAFELGTDTMFAGTCLRLARACARDAGKAEPVAHATPTWMVLRGISVPRGATLYILNANRVRHSAGPAMVDLNLTLVESVRAGDVLFAHCDAPLFWTIETAAGLPDVLGRVPGRNTAALRAACLLALAPHGGPTAALLHEMQVLTPAVPRRHDDPACPLGAALELALPDGEGGLFLRGWLRDPLHLFAGAELHTPLGTIKLTPGQLHRVRRPDLLNHYARAAFTDAEPRPGFVAHVPDPSGGLCVQPTLVLRLRSGNTVEATAPLRHLPPAVARDAVLSCVAPDAVTPLMLDACLAPAAAALHRQVLARRGMADVVPIGAPVRNPAVSIVVPLYRNLGFLRFQVAALAMDAECRKAELVYVLDSPEQRAEVEHLLRGLHALHGLAFTMVVMADNYGYAAANNAGAALARGASLLLLNSDVVPACPGWLAAMRAALAMAGVGAVGPKLMFDDGSIQHAGLFFERDADGVWFNAHYHKGMPRHWPAAARRRRVPGVTGAALLVRRALWDAVGGVNEDYIIGDYEDSDFCLRLQAAGGTIAYVPEAELFHFERRSIQLHTGYTRTLASIYNRRLHHQRWDGAITELMARRQYRPAA